MVPQPPSDSTHEPSIRDRLHQLALHLRGHPHLGPEAQTELAELLDDLGREIAPERLTVGEEKHLHELVTHVAEALGAPGATGVFGAAKDRLEEMVVDAEVRAPFAAGIARRIVAALTDLGI